MDTIAEIVPRRRDITGSLFAICLGSIHLIVLGWNIYKMIVKIRSSGKSDNDSKQDL